MRKQAALAVQSASKLAFALACTVFAYYKYGIKMCVKLIAKNNAKTGCARCATCKYNLRLLSPMHNIIKCC